MGPRNQRREMTNIVSNTNRMRLFHVSNCLLVRKVLLINVHRKRFSQLIILSLTRQDPPRPRPVDPAFPQQC